MDYAKYNIYFQNVWLAGTIKESAHQADYLWYSIIRRQTVILNG